MTGAYPVDTPTMCQLLHARYAEVIGALAGLPVAGSVGEQGRSLSVSSSELKGQLELITEQAAALGCPVGRINTPAVFISRGRA